MSTRPGLFTCKIVRRQLVTYSQKKRLVYDSEYSSVMEEQQQQGGDFTGLLVLPAT